MPTDLNDPPYGHIIGGRIHRMNGPYLMGDIATAASPEDAERIVAELNRLSALCLPAAYTRVLEEVLGGIVARIANAPHGCAGDHEVYTVQFGETELNRLRALAAGPSESGGIHGS